MTEVEITRVHEFDAGHRVHGHEGKCAMCHGHRYRVEMTATAPALDAVGRVIDFGDLKTLFGRWLDDNWDHRMLLWTEDPLLEVLRGVEEIGEPLGLVGVRLNPTAENLAALLLVRFNELLLEAGYCDDPDGPRNIRVTRVTVHETPKCSATVSVS